MLIAVYRYLSELGCRWVRPGADGELIPVVDDPLSVDVHVSESPSYRHRGLAIESACSCEHVTDLIEWLPRVGMNTYFIEYFHGFIFYNNWYSERHRTENRTKLMPADQAEDYGERAIEEIKKRGLLFHRAGHGWTCLPLGIPPELWNRDADAEALTVDHFASTFGSDADRCREYLEGVSEGFSARWLSTYRPGSDPAVPAGVISGLQEVRDRIDAFHPVIDRNRGLSNGVQARSWDYLGYHADLCRILSHAIEAELTGPEAEAKRHWKEMEAAAIDQEKDTNPAFDTFLFLLSMRRKFRGLQRIGME